MKKYELFLILPGTLDENESEEKMNEVLSVINEFGSESSVKSMGKNRLSYPINNVRYGYLYTIIFQSEPQNIKIIEEKLKLFRGLLRAVLSNYNVKIEGAENNKFFSNENKAIISEEPIVENLTTETSESEKMTTEDESDKEEVSEKNEEKVVEKEIIEEKKEEPEIFDLKEIDKKLDEILSDDNINI